MLVLHISCVIRNLLSLTQGFPQMLTCRLSNTSVVPMSFGLRIPGDGTGQASSTSTDQVAQLNRNEWGLGDKTERRPKEFILSPSTGTVRAMAEIDIQVCLLFLILSWAVNVLSRWIPQSDLNQFPYAKAEVACQDVPYDLSGPQTSTVSQEMRNLKLSATLNVHSEQTFNPY